MADPMSTRMHWTKSVRDRSTFPTWYGGGIAGWAPWPGHRRVTDDAEGGVFTKALDEPGPDEDGDYGVQQEFCSRVPR